MHLPVDICYRSICLLKAFTKDICHNRCICWFDADVVKFCIYQLFIDRFGFGHIALHIFDFMEKDAKISEFSFHIFHKHHFQRIATYYFICSAFLYYHYRLVFLIIILWIPKEVTPSKISLVEWYNEVLTNIPRSVPYIYFHKFYNLVNRLFGK